MKKQSSLICVLVIATVLCCSLDVFGQFGSRWRRQRPNPNPNQQSLKYDIVLETNSSSRREWKQGEITGVAPTKNILEKAKDPGSSTIISWEFSDIQKNGAERSASFHFTAFDSENSPIKAAFTFYPNTGKFRVKYNSGIGADWDIDSDQTKNIQPTKKVRQNDKMPGSPTTIEWTLGSIVAGADKGTAVFKFNWRGDDYTEVKIYLSK